MCSARVSSTSVTSRVTLITNPVISHEGGKDWKHLTFVEYLLILVLMS
jgi:hypothetical protein